MDTGSGQSAGPAVTTGVFLPDGRLVARTTSGDLVLLTEDRQIAATLPAPGDAEIVLLGYVG